MPKGHTKGSQNERVIARLFDVWWGVPKGTFRRTHHTGGWYRHCDIYSKNLRISGNFPFITEAKHYKNYNLLDVLKDKKSDNLFSWWEQTVDQYNRCLVDALVEDHEIANDIYPLLLFKTNNQPHCVMLYERDYNRLVLSPYYKFGHLNKNHVIIHNFKRDPKPLLIMKWEDFTEIFGRSSDA